MANPLIAVRIAPKLNKKLEKYAKLLDRPKAWIIRQGLEGILEEIEDAAIASERLNDPKAEYMSFDELKKELNLN